MKTDAEKQPTRRRVGCFSAEWGFSAVSEVHYSIGDCKNKEYAKRNGLPNPTYFTGDGISGARFGYSGFTAMMDEVDTGRVWA